LDQIHEKNELQDIKEQLKELLKLQEMILQRLEQLERAVAGRNR
jgi:replicative DNA helicase